MNSALGENKDQEPMSDSASRVADVLLDIGSTLMTAGAHCGRVHRNVSRVARAWGYDLELFISFTGITVSIRGTGDPQRRMERIRSCRLPAVHFGIVTEISLLTWRITEDKLPIGEVEACMTKIKAMPHHPRSWLLAGAGASCGCLCLLAGGDWTNAVTTFAASVCGLIVRQEILKWRFNPMISFILASLVTTLIAGAAVVWHVGAFPEKALASSVLYLIPGVPLINCVIDLIDGHLPTAIARGVFGGFILLCIAVGMSAGIILLGISNF